MIKTTKTDFKQKQVFHDDVDIKGKLIVQGADDIVDETGKKIIDDSTSGVTIDTEQTITGVKHFKTNNYQFTVGGSAVEKPSDSTALFIPDKYGTYYEGGFHARNTIGNNVIDIYILSYASYLDQYGISIVNNNSSRDVFIDSEKIGFYRRSTVEYQDGVIFLYNKMTLKDSSGNYRNISYPYHVTADTSMAVLTDINATTALTLTNVSGHRYTGTISTTNKVECIVDIDGAYTANFNIAKGMKTAFLMVYGTSSTDVATCFATMDSSGLITIDLDNVSLSSFTPTCKYIIYN